MDPLSLSLSLFLSLSFSFFALSLPRTLTDKEHKLDADWLMVRHGLGFRTRENGGEV